MPVVVNWLSLAHLVIQERQPNKQAVQFNFLALDPVSILGERRLFCQSTYPVAEWCILFSYFWDSFPSKVNQPKKDANSFLPMEIQRASELTCMFALPALDPVAQCPFRGRPSFFANPPNGFCCLGLTILYAGPLSLCCLGQN